MDFSKIQLYVFDLDGTLYEDTEHFDYYALQMKNRLPKDKQVDFEREYQQMKEGNHLIQFGKAYDANRDLILNLDPMTLEVIEVHDWNGQALLPNQIKGIYRRELAFDFEHLIAIGDGWWLPYVAARHLGLSPEDAFKSYIATKEFMVSENFHLTRTPGLIDWLKKLRQNRPVVLMTNSEREDVDRLLHELGLTGLFTEEITSAFKPARSLQHLDRLCKDYHVKPEQVLCIGDNFMNEIAPALKMGMKGLFISPHQIPIEHPSIELIPSLTAVIPGN